MLHNLTSPDDKHVDAPQEEDVEQYEQRRRCRHSDEPPPEPAHHDDGQEHQTCDGEHGEEGEGREEAGHHGHGELREEREAAGGQPRPQHLPWRPPQPVEPRRRRQPAHRRRLLVLRIRSTIKAAAAPHPARRSSRGGTARIAGLARGASISPDSSTGSEGEPGNRRRCGAN
ncbi:Os03g0275450, partial [Oryza sativa Japonica Group]